MAPSTSSDFTRSTGKRRAEALFLRTGNRHNQLARGIGCRVPGAAATASHQSATAALRQRGGVNGAGTRSHLWGPINTILTLVLTLVRRASLTPTDWMLPTRCRHYNATCNPVARTMPVSHPPIGSSQHAADTATLHATPLPKPCQSHTHQLEASRSMFSSSLPRCQQQAAVIGKRP